MKYKLPFRNSVVLALIAAISIAVAGQQTQPNAIPSVERLRVDIEYLASDKLAGRRTGSPGANLAAEYIALEFARIGLRRSIGYDTAGMSILEADSPNRYLQKFPYVAGVELGKNNLLRMKSGVGGGSAVPRVGEDWMPLGFSSNDRIESAGVVFAGYGISSTELKYDDYAFSNVKNKVAVAFAGTPDDANPHGQFGRAGQIRFKAVAARAAGARALVIIASTELLKDDKLSRIGYDNAGEAGIPVLVVSRQVALEMLGGSGSDLSVFEKVADSRGVSSNAGGDYSVFRRLREPSKRTLNLSVDVVRREVQSTNVIGILDGSDPKLKHEAIVIGAHYDHLGLGGEGSLAPKEGEIHHGADDNASGTSGMLELARLFTVQNPRPRRTIIFVAFGGEEEGLLGSNYYVNHPIVPLANTVAMLNMDMIGRMKDNKLIVGGVGTAQEWRNMIASENFERKPHTLAELANPALTPGKVTMVVSTNGQMTSAIVHTQGFDLTLNEDGFGPSDHSSFYAKQIPVLFFWTGTHEDYHKPSDTAEKINYEDEARILSLLVRLVRDIDAEVKRPTYAVAKSQPAARTGGFSVSLGTIPNYGDSNDGLLIDGVRDDSPAAKSGIKAGDKIVKLATRDIRNVYDYTAALGEMRAGQEYDVELMRAGERLKLKIVPAARR